MLFIGVESCESVFRIAATCCIWVVSNYEMNSRKWTFYCVPVKSTVPLLLMHTFKAWYILHNILVKCCISFTFQILTVWVAVIVFQECTEEHSLVGKPPLIRRTPFFPIIVLAPAFPFIFVTPLIHFALLFPLLDVHFLFSVKIRWLWIMSPSREEYSCNLVTFAMKNIHSWMGEHLRTVRRCTLQKIGPQVQKYKASSPFLGSVSVQYPHFLLLCG